MTYGSESHDHAPPLPFLPFDLISEILCRLPVKLLIQLRCVCKSWKSLISSTKFAKKHLKQSKLLRLCFLSHKCTLTTYSPDSLFTNITINYDDFKNHSYEDYCHLNKYKLMCSCNGILCFAEIYTCSIILWNPSIKHYMELPPFEKPNILPTDIEMTFGFGYDSFSDNYKVVALISYDVVPINSIYDDEWVKQIEVKVYTLGTYSWRNIQEFPFDGALKESTGKFVSGTINWLATDNLNETCIIVSFDLEKESYQKVPSPEGINEFSALGVLKDCLCITSGDDVWIMKEYGNKESWTKLLIIPYKLKGLIKPYDYARPVYMFEDDRVLLEFIGFELTLALYNLKDITLRSIKFQNTLEICVESLISPYYYTRR